MTWNTIITPVLNVLAGYRIWYLILWYVTWALNIKMFLFFEVKCRVFQVIIAWLGCRAELEFQVLGLCRFSLTFIALIKLWQDLENYFLEASLLLSYMCYKARISIRNPKKLQHWPRFLLENPKKTTTLAKISTRKPPKNYNTGQEFLFFHWCHTKLKI